MRLKVRPSKLNLARRIDGRRSSGPRPNHILLPWWGATILWHCAAARTQTLLASLKSGVEESTPARWEANGCGRTCRSAAAAGTRRAWP